MHCTLVCDMEEIVLFLLMQNDLLIILTFVPYQSIQMIQFWCILIDSKTFFELFILTIH